MPRSNHHTPPTVKSNETVGSTLPLSAPECALAPPRTSSNPPAAQEHPHVPQACSSSGQAANAVAERLIDLLEKAERRGDFALAESDLAKEIARDFDIAIEIAEDFINAIVGTDIVARTPRRRGVVLHRPPSCRDRAHRGVLHVIRRSQQNGHAALPLAELVSTAATLLFCDGAVAEDAIQTLVKEGVVVVEKVGSQVLVYTRSAHSAEVAMVRRLMELTAASAVKIPRRRRIRKTIAKAEKRARLALNSDQAEAIITILGEPVCLITGAPGLVT